MRTRRPARLSLLAAVVAGLALCVLPASASAHALVRSSDPADGAILQQSPSAVTITFTEPPDPVVSSIHVLDSTGKNVETGTTEPVPGKPPELRVPVGTLPEGVYTVTWRTVSRTDGHVTAGSFSFGVGVAPARVTGNAGGQVLPESPSPAPLAVAGRWLFYWGLAALFGGAVAGVLIRPGAVRGHTTLLVAGWAATALGVVFMTVAQRSTVGVSFGVLWSSGAGHDLIARAVAVVLAGLAVVWAVMSGRRGEQGPPRPPLEAVIVTSGVAMFVHVLAGHASAPSRFRWFNLAAQWVHLAAVGVWIGGLLWLFVLLWATRSAVRPPDVDAEHWMAAVRRFSTIAAFALLAVAVTGVLRALDEVGPPAQWARLIDTSFGITLLVKVALFVELVALGAWNRYVNVPRAAERSGHFRRTVVAEIVLAAGVLAATAVLSELAPSVDVARAATQAEAPQQVVATGSDFATTVRVRLVLTPGSVGPNAFQAKVTDYDTGRPIPATSVALRFELPSRPDVSGNTLELRKGPLGTWTGSGTALAIDGTWNVTVVVQQPAGGVEVPLRVTTRAPPEQISVSKVPGQPTLYTITLPGRGSLQTYIDPGSIGANAVHFTFFKSSGDELAIATAAATAEPPGEASRTIELKRFDNGHFTANVELAAGRWRFRIQATTTDGDVVSGYFDQAIGG
jgi:copper transport protein